MTGALQKLSRKRKLDLLALLEEKIRRNQLLKRFTSLYGWQKRFIGQTKLYRACLLMAANQVGKTLTGTTIDAIHITGDYPEDWEGHRFEKAPTVWILGYSGDKIRDLLQSPIFGHYENGQLSGGLIDKSLILDAIPMIGTPRCVRTVYVKHKSGDKSVVQFWSYSQGQHALMGDVVDWYHIDEEPKDRYIFPQVITRTANGDGGNGGRGILTFTPENGRTELVKSFMDDPGHDQYMQRATWDDAPHLSEETKESLLSIYPDWQRDMRTRGEPLLGMGLVFNHNPEELKVDAFECPDHWYVINGMDFGYDHPQSHIQLWWDKDDDCFYIAKAWKKRETLPEHAWHHVKEWAKKIPTAWPMDGLQTEKGSGKQQKSYYQEQGWRMLKDHATWPDGGNGVEAGILEMHRLMINGKLKVFRHLFDVFDELINYHRDDNGKIVKTNDDLLDAIRYAYMMRRFSIQKNALTSSDQVYIPKNRMGR